MRLIPFSQPTLDHKEIKEILKVIAGGWLTSGKEVSIFEQRLSDYLGVRFVRALNSCTSALELAVLACGIKEDDEVITTAFTFCATVNIIIHRKARPVFADIDRQTFNISPKEVEKKITPQTKAILIMHYGGLACDMGMLLSLAKKYNLKIIEDAAHAFGAEYRAKKIGTFSDLTCFSFHATKHITTAEGGAIATPQKDIFDFINKAYFHGIDRESWQRKKSGGWEYRVVYPGYKYNMSDLLAAIGIQQLKKIDSFIKKRNEIASLYNEAFRDSHFLELQKAPYPVRHTYYLYPVCLRLENLKIERRTFIEELKKKKIICSVHFIPIYKHPAYANFFTKDIITNLKNTEDVYRRIVSLPIYPRLTGPEVRYIIKTVKRILEDNRKNKIFSGYSIGKKD